MKSKTYINELKRRAKDYCWCAAGPGVLTVTFILVAHTIALRKGLDPGGKIIIWALVSLASIAGIWTIFFLGVALICVNHHVKLRIIE